MPNPAAVLARGRAAAEALMVDACTIRRQVDEDTDRDTGEVTPDLEVVYTGRCRVQQTRLGAASSAADPGEAEVRLLALELQVPMSVVGLRVGDVATVDTSVHDDDLVDRLFVVTGLAHKTHATARRLQVQEVAT